MHTFLHAMAPDLEDAQTDAKGTDFARFVHITSKQHWWLRNQNDSYQADWYCDIDTPVMHRHHVRWTVQLPVCGRLSAGKGFVCNPQLH